MVNGKLGNLFYFGDPLTVPAVFKFNYLGQLMVNQMLERFFFTELEFSLVLHLILFAIACLGTLGENHCTDLFLNKCA